MLTKISGLLLKIAYFQNQFCLFSITSGLQKKSTTNKPYFWRPPCKITYLRQLAYFHLVKADAKNKVFATKNRLFSLSERCREKSMEFGPQKKVPKISSIF
jgi:hypothetical protein